MYIPIYIEQRQLHVQPALLSQQHLHKRVTSDNGGVSEAVNIGREVDPS